MGGSGTEIVRKCLKCKRRFPEEFDEGYACGSAFTISGTLTNPDWPCPKAYCLQCAQVESSKQKKFVFESCHECLRSDEGDAVAPTWCQDCAADKFKRCKCCQHQMCSDCELMGYDTTSKGQPYGFLCEKCGELMMDKDQNLKDAFVRPGSILASLPRDWYPSREYCDLVDKLYDEIHSKDEPASVVCDGCGRPPFIRDGKQVPLRQCTRCRAASYHSTECQKQHYPKHKVTCRAAAKTEDTCGQEG